MGRTAKSKPKKKATPKNSDHQNTQGFNAAEIKGAADADTKKEEKLTEKQKADLKFKSVLLMVSAALVLLLVFIPGSSGSELQYKVNVEKRSSISGNMYIVQDKHLKKYQPDKPSDYMYIGNYHYFTALFSSSFCTC